VRGRHEVECDVHIRVGNYADNFRNALGIEKVHRLFDFTFNTKLHGVYQRKIGQKLELFFWLWADSLEVTKKLLRLLGIDISLELHNNGVPFVVVCDFDHT
jgi:hypothetical protein